jgi:hypothetical protein
LHATREPTFPTLHKGRYQPAISYGQSWLYDYYRSHNIKSNNKRAFNTTSSSPLPFLFQINSLGADGFRKTPLFWIQSSELKTLLQLPLDKNRFHYDEIIQNFPVNQEQQSDEFSNLFSKVKECNILKSFRVALHSMQSRNPCVFSHVSVRITISPSFNNHKRTPSRDLFD